MSGLLEDGYLVGTKHICRLCKKERTALEVRGNSYIVFLFLKLFVRVCRGRLFYVAVGVLFLFLVLAILGPRASDQIMFVFPPFLTA